MLYRSTRRILTPDNFYTGYSVRGGYNVRTGMHSGNISSKSNTIGDIVIISPNQIDIILRDVANCQGVRDLILALRKNVINQLDR